MRGERSNRGNWEMQWISMYIQGQIRNYLLKWDTPDTMVVNSGSSVEGHKRSWKYSERNTCITQSNSGINRYTLLSTYLIHLILWERLYWSNQTLHRVLPWLLPTINILQWTWLYDGLGFQHLWLEVSLDFLEHCRKKSAASKRLYGRGAATSCGTRTFGSTWVW